MNINLITNKIMEEKKRRSATQSRMAEYISQNPIFEDKNFIECLIKPNTNIEYCRYEDFSYEIIKEMYRRWLPLDEASFLLVFKNFEEEGRLRGYEVEWIKQRTISNEVDNLVNKIYNEAKNRTVFLSDFEEWNNPGVREVFEEKVSSDRSLAQVFYYRLNRLAMEENGLDSLVSFEHCLPFHSYSEPNGDVVFTKNKRGLECYDENGNPLYSERQLADNIAASENDINNAMEKLFAIAGAIIVLVVLFMILF